MKICINNKLAAVKTENSEDVKKFLDFCELLTVTFPNARFSEKFKNGYWDGKIRYVNQKDGSFDLGFLPLFEEICPDAELIDKRIKNVTFSGDVIEKNELFNYYEHQVEGQEVFKQNKCYGVPFQRGILRLATNAGKTPTLAAIVSTIKEGTSLTLVHRTRLKDDILANYADIGVEATDFTKTKTIKTNHVVSTIQSLYKHMKTNPNVMRFLKNLGCLIVDEAHRVTAKNYQKLYKQTNPYSVLFVSGSIKPSWQQDYDALKIIGMSGVPLLSVEKSELINKGISQKPTVRLYRYAFEHSNLKGYDRIKYSINRRKVIKKAVEDARENGYILITVHHSDHAKFLMLETGGVLVTASDNKKDAIEKFKSGEIPIMYATMWIQEGENIPEIRTLINAAGGDSFSVVTQLCGRAERNDGENNTVNIVDFYSLCGSDTRYNIYKSHKFEITREK